MILIMAGTFHYCFPATRLCWRVRQNVHVQLPVDNGQHLRFSSRNFGNAPDGAAILAPIPQKRFNKVNGPQNALFWGKRSFQFYKLKILLKVSMTLEGRVLLRWLQCLVLRKWRQKTHVYCPAGEDLSFSNNKTEIKR